MIYIRHLFDQFLLLFYEVTYQLCEHVDSLIRDSLYRTCVKYYSLGFQIMYNINRMEECFVFPQLRE
jgi:hypothetical protein